MPSRELKRRYDCRISGRPITTSRLPQLSVAPRIPARSINGHDRNGRACCGMRRSTSRVLSRLPPLFGARVGSTSVRRDLPAASDDTVRTSVERRNVDRVHDLRIVVGSIDIRRKKDPGIRPELRLPRPHLNVNSLGGQNSSEISENVRELSKGYFAPTFLSSSPICPATQSGLCGICPGCRIMCRRGRQRADCPRGTER